MRLFHSVPAGVAALLLPLSVLAAESPPRPTELIAPLLPSVVSILALTHVVADPVKGNIASQPTASDRTAQASGFIIAPVGVIVTNRHGIAGASEITVALSDSTQLRACVLASATHADIALLRVNAGRPLPVATFGDSDRLRPGDQVFTIGNPLGLGNTVTAGIVSALDRNTPESGFDAFFQFDASMNHGSSGAPVFDGSGKVVGIATALYSPGEETGSVGLGLAIPATDAKFVVEQLLAGSVPRLGWIGIHVQPVTADLAAALKLPVVAGAMITDIEDDSAAIRAGLGVGDVILKVGGEAEENAQQLNRRLARSAVGSATTLTLWRDGAEVSVPIIIGEAPPEKPQAKTQASVACGSTRPESRDLGLVLGPLTDDARVKLGLDLRSPGVAIIDVVANTPAADRGLAAGSVILDADRRAVASPADLQARIEAARAAGHDFVLLLVESRQGLRWVALPTG